MDLNPLIADWTGCTLCGLGDTRVKQVFYRGDVPADVMFIGLGPGKSENVVGKPFVGPSGVLLDIAIGDALDLLNNPKRSMHFTNVVCCRPCDSKLGPNRDPTLEEALMCSPRLMKQYEVVQPKRIIFLGRVTDHLCKHLFPDGRYLLHPAAVLRAGGMGSKPYIGYVRDLSSLLR